MFRRTLIAAALVTLAGPALADGPPAGMHPMLNGSAFATPSTGQGFVAPPKAAKPTYGQGYGYGYGGGGLVNGKVVATVGVGAGVGGYSSTFLATRRN